MYLGLCAGCSTLGSFLLLSLLLKQTPDLCTHSSLNIPQAGLSGVRPGDSRAKRVFKVSPMTLTSSGVIGVAL